MHPWCRCGYTIEVPDFEEWERGHEERHGDVPDDALAVSEAYVPRKRGVEHNAFTVDYSAVNKKAYRDKYDRLPLPKPVRDALYREAGRILRERDGTDIESTSAIDARSGEVVARTGGNRLFAAFDTKQQKAIMASANGTVFIHNHPGSSYPSSRDILTTIENDYVACQVVVCHDGGVFFIENVNPDEYMKRWNKLFEALRIELDSDKAAQNAAFAILDKENGRGKWYKVSKRP